MSFHLSFSVEEDVRAEWHFHNAEGHKRKSARAERSKFKPKFRYPLRGSASGTGKSGYMVALTVFLARDVPEEVFYIIAGIPNTVALKRAASTWCTCSLTERTDPTGKLPNQFGLVASCSRTVIFESCRPIRRIARQAGLAAFVIWRLSASVEVPL